MGYITSGNDIVDAMAKINVTGNLIPQIWYQTIRTEKNKPYLMAITILADIVYWYRPVEMRDEISGAITGWKKKFSGNLLRRSYGYYEEMYGESRNVIKAAILRLEDIGVIRREFRTITYSDGNVCNNVMYIAQKKRQKERILQRILQRI